MITDRIKELCEEKGISISELAEKIGVSRASVGKWNKSSPSSDTIAKIANYFGVSTDYILGISEYRYYVNPTNDSGIISIQRAREKMSDKEKANMDQLLKISFADKFGGGNDDET